MEEFFDDLNNNDRFVEHHTPLRNDVNLRIGVNRHDSACEDKILIV